MKLEDLPDWTGHNHVFACPKCWDEDVLVALGIGHEAYVQFSRNALQLTCPRCEYTHVRHQTRYAKSTGVLMWHPMHLEPYLRIIVEKDMEIWRVPLKNDRGEFYDDIEFGRPNSFPQTSYSYSGK